MPDNQRPAHNSIQQLLADMRSLGWIIPTDVEQISIRDGIVRLYDRDGYWDFTVPMYHDTSEA